MRKKSYDTQSFKIKQTEDKNLYFGYIGKEKVVSIWFEQGSLVLAPNTTIDLSQLYQLQWVLKSMKWDYSQEKDELKKLK